MDRHHKKWTDDEDMELEAMVGVYKIDTIAARLGRTVGAVDNRVRRLGIGGTKDSTGLLTVSQMADALGVDWYTVDRWRGRGLKSIKKVTRLKERYILIDPEDFWKWAEDNKELINFAKIKPHSLPPEPDWVGLARKRDYRDIPKRAGRRWTDKEDNQLIMLANAGVDYDEIAKRLHRSRSSIEHRVSKLGQQGKAELRKIRLPWTDEEVGMLLERDRQGVPDIEIAYELGREIDHVRDKRRNLRKQGKYSGHKAQNRARIC